MPQGRATQGKWRQPGKTQVKMEETIRTTENGGRAGEVFQNIIWALTTGSELVGETFYDQFLQIHL
jgi:hypothetical protein